jgi:hypothetical protein
MERHNVGIFILRHLQGEAEGNRDSCCINNQFEPTISSIWAYMLITLPRCYNANEGRSKYRYDSDYDVYAMQENLPVYGESADDASWGQLVVGYVLGRL